MIWTKIGDEFPDQCRDLSDAAFRTHVEGLSWVMRRETGGWLDAREVKRFAESPHAEMAVAELVACGWWSLDGQGYRINHHMDVQIEPEVLAKRRENDAARQRRHREKKAGLSPRDDVRDHPRDPGLGWSGLVSTGSKPKNAQQQNNNAPAEDEPYDVDQEPPLVPPDVPRDVSPRTSSGTGRDPEPEPYDDWEDGR